MSESRLREVNSLGQSIWYDNISRSLLASGEIEDLIRLGVTGVTSNPTIFEKAISGSTDYDETMVSLASQGYDSKDTYERLAMEDICSVADLLLPTYNLTQGRDGYASIEVNPGLAHNTGATITEAERLFATLNRPNIMIKVPATPEGITAVRALISKGVNVNVTLIFSLEAYAQVMEAYLSGLENLCASGGELDRVASVASFFVSRVDTVVDTLLEDYSRQGRKESAHLLGKIAIANAKLAYKSFRATFTGARFAALSSRGANVQKPLWASTGTKNPAYSDVLYVDNLIGKDTVNTMPPATMMAFIDHGQLEHTLEQGEAEAEQVMKALALSGIDIGGVTEKLLADGVKSFSDSFDQLLVNIEQKRALLLAEGRHGYSLARGVTHSARAE